MYDNDVRANEVVTRLPELSDLLIAKCPPYRPCGPRGRVFGDCSSVVSKYGWVVGGRKERSAVCPFSHCFRDLPRQQQLVVHTQFSLELKTHPPLLPISESIDSPQVTSKQR